MTYWSQSRSPLYSFLFTIPLFIIYEVGIFFISKDDIFIIRNGADAIMRQLLEHFGGIGLYGIGFTYNKSNYGIAQMSTFIIYY